jgi:phosphate:Na+ symporter
MVIVRNVLIMLAGLGAFLIGMHSLSQNMQSVAGEKIKKMLARISDKKLTGIGIGVGAAAILESSSATTVILLGLVNAGVVNLLQATLIIMGANVGTTFSVVIFSFNYLPMNELLASLAIVGVAIITSAKRERTKNIGWIIAGFGLIFIGLETMENGVSFLKDSLVFVNLMGKMRNPFLLVFVGILFSGIVQSSTAVTGIVITLSEAGIIPLNITFYVILGSNIGTCATAIIASLSANINAKRTALIHLLFNVIGVLIFLPLLILFGNSALNPIVNKLSPAVIIAYFHIIFNFVTTLILIPFVKRIVSLSEILLPNKPPPLHIKT